MTNKSINFKRIALVVIAALGFGALSTGPSQAYLTNSPTLTLSASSATIAPGDTATVTGTVTFTSTWAGESLNVLVDSATNNASPVFFGLSADSVNVLTGNGNDGPPEANYFKVGPTSTNPDSFVAATGTGMFIPSAATDGTLKNVTAKFTLNVRTSTAIASTSAQSFLYTVVLRQVYNGATTNLATASFTVNVSAIDTTATAAKSKIYINQVSSTAAAATQGIESDSALVVSAGTVTTGAQTYTAHGAIWAVFNNASDTNIAGPIGNQSNVNGTITLNVSGPGLLSNGTTGYTTRSKSITMVRGDTAVIWSDGTAGTMTITGYIGGVALTQAAKTATFFGKAASLTAYETSVVANNGGASLSSNPADSVLAGTKIMYVQAKDSAGNTVKSGSLNANGNLWCISSDTTVASLTTTNSATDASAASTASYVVATAPGASETYWTCNVRPLKEGTATIYLADDTVVATASLTASKTFTFAKQPAALAGYKGKGTISFDKSTYNVGEKATITITVLNASGNKPGMDLVAGDAYTRASVFPTLVQNVAFSGVGQDATSSSGNLGFGGGSGTRNGTLVTDWTGSTFTNGVETYVVYMPTTPGDLTITGFTTDGTNDTATAVSVTVKVVDPLEAVIKAQVDAAKATAAAAQASADAATDAALQAIDAANAATDAANLAAEAADAATVAAQESKDAADAATAAVESLATQVATLMAALQAQITSLANVVAKIAKKVKA